MASSNINGLSKNTTLDNCNDMPWTKFSIIGTETDTKTCLWLNSIEAKLKASLCQNLLHHLKSTAAKYCPDTCGDLCNCFDKKANTFSHKGRIKNCKWISYMMKHGNRRQFCRKNHEAASSCPSTCSGWCHSNNLWNYHSLSISPSVSTTKNNEFTISLLKMGPVESRFDIAFQNAKKRWEEIIVGDVPDEPGLLYFFDWFDYFFGFSYNGPVDDVVIGYHIDYIDGEGGVLGFAGPRIIRKGSYIPVSGIMKFDSEDFKSMSQSDIELVILHEMGHVLGIGPIWKKVCGNDCYNGDTNYKCNKASKEFKRIVNQYGTLRLQPYECMHWAEDNFGYLNDELMTPIFDEDMYQPISRVTVGALEDVGYQVDYAAADPYESSNKIIKDKGDILYVSVKSQNTPETSFILDQSKIKRPRFHVLE